MATMGYEKTITVCPKFPKILLAELKIKTQKTILQHLSHGIKENRIVLAFSPLQPLFSKNPDQIILRLSQATASDD